MSGLPETAWVNSDQVERAKRELSFAELAILQRHVLGEVICPRALVVEVNDLTKPILEKLKE